MGVKTKGVKCGVVEWMKHDTLRQYGYVMSMPKGEFVKRVYKSNRKVEGGWKTTRKKD